VLPHHGIARAGIVRHRVEARRGGGGGRKIWRRITHQSVGVRRDTDTPNNSRFEAARQPFARAPPHSAPRYTVLSRIGAPGLLSPPAAVRCAAGRVREASQVRASPRSPHNPAAGREPAAAPSVTPVSATSMACM
jgi:hypothetical protein